MASRRGNDLHTGRCARVGSAVQPARTTLRGGARANHTTRGKRTTEDALATMKVVLFIKYGAESTVVLAELSRDGLRNGGQAVLERLASLSVVSMLSAIPVVITIVIWLRRRGPTAGLVAMSAVVADALLKVVRMGPFFLNHFLLQALVGATGMLAAGREIAGDRREAAWRPLAELAVMVWILAAAKKLLHGSYLNGEYLASTTGLRPPTGLSRISTALLSRSDGIDVPGVCCMTSDIAVPVVFAAMVVAFGVLMIAAETAPFIAFFIAPPATLAWLMLILSILATVATAEFDFGLLNIAIVSLWWSGRGFRRASIASAAAFAVLLVWRSLS